MANRSIASMFALHNQQLAAAEGELRNWDWEVVEGEDLYADIDSLESFSISSADEDDGQEQQSEGAHADQDDIHGEFGGFNLAVNVLGQDLQVTRSELPRPFDFGDGAFYSADYNEDDVVGEPIDRDVVPLVDPLGFHVGSGRFVVPHHDQGFLDQSIGKEDDKGIDAHDDDDGSEYESDVDDELVPWGVADRLERQRMRKLGKRTCARMNKSKKMAHLYTKAACLHGKHGLGLKAY